MVLIFLFVVRPGFSESVPDTVAVDKRQHRDLDEFSTTLLSSAGLTKNTRWTSVVQNGLASPVLPFLRCAQVERSSLSTQRFRMLM